MSESEKRLRIAELQNSLKVLKPLIPEEQYRQHEAEVTRKIEELSK